MGSQRVGHSLMTKQQQQPHVVRELFGFLSVGNKSESLLLAIDLTNEHITCKIGASLVAQLVMQETGV